MDSEVETKGEDEVVVFNHAESRLHHCLAQQLPHPRVQSDQHANDSRRRGKVAITITYDMRGCYESIKGKEVLKRCSLVLESDTRITIRKSLNLFACLLYNRTRGL